VPKRLQFAQSVRSPCRPVKVGWLIITY
jgi:hypothetical protein